MSVPEVAGYEHRGRIVAYAFRQPGAILWSGFVSGEGRHHTTEARYRSPADAVDAARYQWGRGTGNFVEDLLFPPSAD